MKCHRFNQNTQHGVGKFFPKYIKSKQIGPTMK